MLPQQDPETITTQQVVLPNGRQAALVLPQPGAAAGAIVGGLKLPPHDEIIVVIGGAASVEQMNDAAQKSRIAQLCSRGIARAAISCKAIIIDGGTDVGVMRMMGRGVADRGHKTPLIGVAPRAKVGMPGDPTLGPDCVALEPNHTHYVLVPGREFGDESPVIADLAAELVKSGNGSGTRATKGTLPNDKTALVVLMGGSIDGVSRTDALLAVRRNFPLVVVEGSGGLADEIARISKNRPAVIPDADLAEIVEDGRIHIFDQKRPVAAMEQLIVRELGTNQTLQDAWRRFGAYDAKAIQLQKQFNSVQPRILALGVLAALFIALRASLPVEYTANGLARVPWWFPPLGLLDADKISISMWIDRGLYGIVALIPIVTAGLLAYASRFNQGARFVVYRSAAEAVKRSIYIYRTRSPWFCAKPGDLPQGLAHAQVEAQQEITREIELQRRVQFISSQLMQSDANAAGLPLYEGDIPPSEKDPKKRWQDDESQDDGISFLTPERYIQVRLDDQIRFYRKRTVTKEAEYHSWQVAGFVAGGVGTALAAIGWQIWVTVTSALATAFVAYLEYRQTRMTLVQYNQTATNLENIRMWWDSLSPEAQAEQKNIERLVETTEEIIAAELTGWVQQMQDALGKLRIDEAKRVGDQDDDGSGKDGENG